MFGIDEPELIFLLAFIIFIILGLIGSRVAVYKRRDVILWFILCAIFPPTIIFLLFLKPKILERHEIKQCPFCKAFIRWDAITCEHCGRLLKEPPIEPKSPDEPDWPFKI